jgi:sugar/nucleoside kinase (ribokinase family)
MYDIISIGSATQDVLLSADGFKIVENADFNIGRGICLPFGSKVQIKKIVFTSGGGGTNASVTFARQGFKTACVGVIGSDTNGSAILDELRREGVDGKYFQIHHDDITAYSVILVGSEGERTILSYKGEGIHWQADTIPWERLQSKWMYVNSLGGHLDMLEHIVAHAKKHGMHLATNPGPKELELGLDRLKPLWKDFDIIGMNQEEASVLTGIPFDKPEQIFKTMDAAIGGIFILTKGMDGAMISDGRNLYSAGIPNKQVVERTGSGDAFHSAFLAEFIRSGNIEKATQLATANATSVVMQYGAKAGILKKGDIGPWPLVKVEKKSL